MLEHTQNGTISTSSFHHQIYTIGYQKLRTPPTGETHKQATKFFKIHGE